MTFRIHGNESISQLLDVLFANADGIYGEIVVTAAGQRYSGRLVERGSNYLVLESDLERHVMGDDGGQIFARSIVAVHAISGVSYEYVKREAPAPAGS